MFVASPDVAIKSIEGAVMKKILLGFRVWLLCALIGNSPSAGAAESPPAGEGAQAARAPAFVTVPIAYGGSALSDHIVMGNQVFETSVAGLRSYLDSIQSTDPRLYVQLNPDLQGLEARRTGARMVLLAGLGVGVASAAYAFLGQKDCHAPLVTDPAFAADSAAWGACNDDNMHKATTFTLVGLGAVIAGAAGWFALTPGRSEYFDFVNKHNRLSPQPLQFQIGYDGARRLATGGAELTF
jgi:hypothetical protein